MGNLSEYSRFFVLYSNINLALIDYRNKNNNASVRESFDYMADFNEILNVFPMDVEPLTRQNNYMDDLLPMFLNIEDDVEFRIMTNVFSEFKADMYAWCHKNKAVY